jgi:hypothetical protein
MYPKGFTSVMRRYDPNLASKKWLSFFNASFAIRLIVIKACVSLSFHLVSGWKPEVSSALMLLFFLMKFWYKVRRLIYSNPATQLFYSACSTLAVYASFLLFIQTSFSDVSDTDRL